MKKEIIIQDYGDPSELKRTITLLQKRRKDVLRTLGYDQIHFNGSQYNFDHIMPVFDEIWDFNLPVEDSDDNSYYLYLHCNPLNGLQIKNDLKHCFLSLKFPNLRHVPFYVGKGKGNRAFDLARNDSHRKIRSKLIERKLDICPYIVMTGLTSSQALNYESKLIDILGLKHLDNHGLLVNLDEGTDFNHRRKILYAQSKNYDKIEKILKRNKFI